eukprot:SAG22_NODE_2890_length_2122_cov_17.812160_2_plen_180_part_01
MRSVCLSLQELLLESGAAPGTPAKSDEKDGGAAAAAAGGGGGGSGSAMDEGDGDLVDRMKVSCKALPFCCVSTAILSKTVPFLAVCLSMKSSEEGRLGDLGAYAVALQALLGLLQSPISKSPSLQVSKSPSLQDSNLQSSGPSSASRFPPPPPRQPAFPQDGYTELRERCEQVASRNASL